MLVALTAAAGAGLPARAADDAAMLALAADSGCLACHRVESGARGPDGRPPVGPAWRDVAARYRDQRDAAETLTATILGGSNPYQSHWNGKASGLAMPPNAVAIREADAKKLVDWILSLQPAKKG
jgi:cytochrome c